MMPGFAPGFFMRRRVRGSAADCTVRRWKVKREFSLALEIAMQKTCPQPSSTSPTFTGTLVRLAGLVICLTAFSATAHAAGVGYALFGAVAFCVGMFSGALLDMSGDCHE